MAGRIVWNSIPCFCSILPLEGNMRLARWERGQFANGDQVEQWIFGLMGSLITTLPVFLLAPIWFIFTNSFRLERGDGRIAKEICFFINLTSAVLVWVFVGGMWHD